MAVMVETKHIPVLLEETIDALGLKNGDKVVDATLGGGGHSLAILDRILPDGCLLAFDADGGAIDRFRDKLSRDGRFSQAEENGQVILFRRNFSEMREALQEAEVEKVDGIMADLGFSSDQIEDGARGLSFSKDGVLDMRLDLREDLTAESIVNGYSEQEIVKILTEYGDERYARRIARAITRERLNGPIVTTTQLAKIVTESVPAASIRKNRIHPATRTFQALRIAVNREYERLETFLPQAVASLRRGGRMAVITFHSGEDRIVKRFIRDSAGGCICPEDFPVCRCGRVPLLRTVFRKPMVPEEEETGSNPRARSAKLRVAERV